MSTVSMNHAAQAPRRDARNALFKRALKATLVAALLVGGGYLWHKVSSERTALRAEQARQESLRMTPRKLEALAREAEIATAAKAYAEKLQAEKAWQDAVQAAQEAAAKAHTSQFQKL